MGQVVQKAALSLKLETYAIPQCVRVCVCVCVCVVMVVMVVKLLLERFEFRGKEEEGVQRSK